MNKHIHRTDILIIAFVLVIATFFRLYQIGQVPPGLFPDEATHALDAMEVLDGHLTIYSPDEGSTGALWRYLLAVNFALFGPSILSLRAFASVMGVLSVVMAYLVVYELSLAPPVRCEFLGSALCGWHRIIAALAALLLAVSYWHVDLSRLAFSAVLMLLILDATFFFLWRALNSGRQRWFVLFGLGLGALAYSYLPGKLVPLIPLIFFLLQWLIARHNTLLVKYWRPLLMAGSLALVIALPFVLFVVFNYQLLAARAAVPTVSAVAPTPPLQGIIASLSVFGLWPTNWLVRHWESLFLGPVLTLCFVTGVGVSLARVRRPAYLFLLIWWLIMLLPGALAPEGAIPHTRRAIGIATVTYALASLGLVTLVSILFWLVRRLAFSLEHKTLGIFDRPGPQVPSSGTLRVCQFLALGLGLLLVVRTATSTYHRYFVQWGPSEAAKLAFHVYDLELADLMAYLSGPETIYLLPLDSAAGSVNPLLDSITFVYQGQASYDFLADDERTIPTRLAELTADKQTARLLHWKVSKHTGSDPKGVARYYLEKWGHWVGTESYRYFDIETYEVDGTSGDLAPATLAPTNISFEGHMVLTGFAYGNASGFPPDEPSATAGDLLWVELAWRKTADFSIDYQVALWLEDQAGHVVGKVDKPLMNNLRHQGTGEWAVDALEQDYYLLPVDLGTMPGSYQLKAVLYAGEDVSRRLAPLLPGVGADLAVPLGEVIVEASHTPIEETALPILQRLDLEMEDGLQLLGFNPGFTDPLRPGDQATLSLWWKTEKTPSKELGVVINISHEQKVWVLNEPQQLGEAGYPTHDWSPGMVVRTFVDLRLPPDVETGDYTLALRLLDMESGVLLADRLLGQMQVTGRERNFEIPPVMHPMEVDFGGRVTLLGYDLDLTQVEAGGAVRLTLYWQAQKEMEKAYIVFVHLLDESGRIVAQVDREPQAGEAPTAGWLAGEVVEDRIEILPEGLERVNKIALGLYDPVNGARLPLRETGADALVLDTWEIIK